jgi:hypothetical protein
LRRPIFDRDEATDGRCGISGLRRRNADVVAVNAYLPGERRIDGIGPLLDQAVPDIGGLAEVGGLAPRSEAVGELGGNQ